MTTINMIEQGALRFYEHGNARLFETDDDNYYFFEHATLGDEGYCGGVWLQDKHIMDYDGVYDLPRDVEAILESLGYAWVHDVTEPQGVDHAKV
jgi:hypothetical protein